MATGRRGTIRVRRAGLTALAALAVILPAAPAAAQEVNMAAAQVWNCDYWQTVSLGDFFGPNYDILKLKPIVLVGARNGTFSGMVVVTHSNGPMRGLKAAASELTGPNGAKIAASQIRVRFSELATPAKSYAPPYRFDALRDQPPDELPTVDLREHRGWKPKNVGPVAMQPIWVTVGVPKDAAPGDYEGKLDIQAEDLALDTVTVAIRLTVHDWEMPDAKDFRIRNAGWQSPERVARHYEVPLWSEKHWQLLGKSLEMLVEIGSRQVILNLVCQYPAQENAESMVRWIKQPDGSFKYDFKLVDRYLDLCAERIGKPFPIRLNMWSAERREPPQRPRVSVLDPATGKLTEMDQPPYGTPESLAFWKPVLDELRQRLEKRGWFDVTVVNWMNYCGAPDAATVSVLRKIWPDAKWSSMDHGRRTSFDAAEEGVRVPVPVSTSVWNEGGLDPYVQWDGQSPGPRAYKDKFKPDLAVCGHARGRHREWSPLWVPRLLCEEMMMRGCHGVDPVGGDLWLIKDHRGQYSHGHSFVAFALGPGNATRAYLAPGEKGAIATERFEALREGVQICEAMLFLQAALDANKITGQLADKANRLLDERARNFMVVYKPIDKEGRRALDHLAAAEGAQKREGELFALAAEVQKAVRLAEAKP